MKEKNRLHYPFPSSQSSLQSIAPLADPSADPGGTGQWCPCAVEEKGSKAHISTVVLKSGTQIYDQTQGHMADRV